MKNLTSKAGLLLICLALHLPTINFAQRAVINGQFIDASSFAKIANVYISIINEEGYTVNSLLSKHNGTFTTDSLTQGRYEVHIKCNGYEAIAVQYVELSDTQVLNLNIVLEKLKTQVIKSSTPSINESIIKVAGELVGTLITGGL